MSEAKSGGGILLGGCVFECVTVDRTSCSYFYENVYLDEEIQFKLLIQHRYGKITEFTYDGRMTKGPNSDQLHAGRTGRSHIF